MSPGNRLPWFETVLAGLVSRPLDLSIVRRYHWALAIVQREWAWRLVKIEQTCLGFSTFLPKGCDNKC
jgi:hypothetical protein